MADAKDRRLERRLQQLIQEQNAGSSPLAAGTAKAAQSPSTQTKAKQHSSPTATGLRNNLGLALAIGLSLLIGLQLGALPWRFRREMLQLQGGLVGLAIGFALGRLTSRRPL